MTFRSLKLLGIVIAIQTGPLACSRQPTQREIEYRMAQQVVSLLKLHDMTQLGGTVTNIAQLYGESGKGYPYVWEQRFRRFGKHAGFAHSIYEKYVFLFPPTNIPPFKGELLFVGAQPFPGDDGTASRVLVCKIGLPGEAYSVHVFPESRVQEILAKGSVKIPVPPQMPPPPPAPPEQESSVSVSDRISGFFAALAEAYQLPVNGWVLQWIVFGVLLILLGLFVAGLFWFGRRGRR